MTVVKDASQKRIIAALIQPQTEEKAATNAELAQSPNSQNVQQPTEYKVRSIQTPVVDKLDPSISFRLQFRKAAEAMEEDDPSYLQNVNETLGKAKKDKLEYVRER